MSFPVTTGAIPRGNIDIGERTTIDDELVINDNGIVGI
jgi:hypothetical protein